MFWRNFIKNLGLILVILGHYYFCGYVLAEVHGTESNDFPVVLDKSNEKKDDENNLGTESKVLKNEVLEDEYLGIISIPKIGLRKKLYDIGSYRNDVDRNIEVLDSSKMPDVMGGNFILAAHNGNTSLGYFRDLHKLKVGDEVTIDYKNKNYVYEVSKIYDVLKTGEVAIKRDKSQSTITLITCLGNDRQLVVIGYLR